jgi:hypothetical protein
VIQPVLPLHECATESLQDAAVSAADPAAAESTDEPLHSAADPTSSVAALTEIFYLCVQF